MAFSFGGATPAPSFGFGQGSTPAFGTSSTPAFGQTSTPAFGAAAGAGLPKAASTPLFGAAPAAVAPGLFGASSTPASSFSFSFSSQPASQPAAAPLFGAAPATTPGTGLFGAAPAATPGTGLFGAAPAAPSGGLFGTAAPAAGAQLAPLGGFGAAAGQGPDLSAVRELESIRAAYTPGDPRYRFQYLLLNVVDNPAARVKPPGVDELQWREALQRTGGPDNPDRLWPVPANGFRDLLARRAAQEEALRENAARLEGLVASVSGLAARQEAVLRRQLEDLRRRHVALTQKLLRIMRHVDALEGRFAYAMGYRGATPGALAAQLQRQLDELEGALAPQAGGGLRGQVEGLAAAARLRGGGGRPLSEVGGLVDEAALRSLQDVMRQYTEAVAKLQDVIKRNEREVGVLESKARGANGMDE